jgi:outer membrane immunogenic protein
MLKFAAVLVAGLSASAAAIAADLPNGEASPGLMKGETAYNWSGIYAGASAGMVWDEITAEYAARTFGTSRANGFIGGLQVGFNKQVGGLVVGLEADYSLSNARGDKTVTALSGAKYGDYTLTGTGNLEAGLANLATVRARIGYAYDNLLIYGTGGYAFGRNKLDLSGYMRATLNGASSTAAQAGSTSNTMSGIAVGAGGEYAFARGVSLKVEYLYIHFVESNFFGTTWAATPTKATLNILRAGVNFRI